MTQSTLAILQARMSSSRLPGKVMKDIAGQPLLQRMLERIMQARLLDGVVVATTLDPSDDILEHLCQDLGVLCFRGSLPDVLDRYYQAARHFHADVIVRLTADCPLIDPALIDLTVSIFLGTPLSQALSATPGLSNPSPSTSYPLHFAANRLPPPWKRTLPIGLDVEVCSFAALECAWLEADQLYQREHVLPFMYEGVKFSDDLSSTETWSVDQGSTPRGFNIALLNHFPDYGSLRWTVDTPEDLEFIRQVYLHIGGKKGFGWQEVLSLLEKEPGLSSINADVSHKSAFDVDHRTKHP